MKGTKGFTLVEIIVAVTILAVLAGVGVVSYNKYIDNAQEKACLANRLEAVRDYEDYCQLFKTEETLAQYVTAQVGGFASLCPAGDNCYGGLKDGKPYIFCAGHENGEASSDVRGYTAKAELAPPNYTPSAAADFSGVTNAEVPKEPEPKSDKSGTGGGQKIELKGDKDTLLMTAKNVYEAFKSYIDSIGAGNLTNTNTLVQVAGQNRYYTSYKSTGGELFNAFLVAGGYGLSLGAGDECRIYLTKESTGDQEKYILDYVYVYRKEGSMNLGLFIANDTYAKYGGEGHQVSDTGYVRFLIWETDPDKRP